MSTELEKQICQEYIEGKTLVYLSGKYNSNNNRIRNILQNNNISSKKRDSDNDKFIIEDYNNGYSLENLAIKNNCGTQKIRRILDKYQIRKVYGQDKFFDIDFTIDKVTANHINKNGYIVEEIKGRSIYQHQRIWIMNKGEIPIGFIIHHKDGNKQNNIIDNLELLSYRDHNKKRFDRIREE